MNTDIELWVADDDVASWSWFLVKGRKHDIFTHVVCCMTKLGKFFVINRELHVAKHLYKKVG